MQINFSAWGTGGQCGLTEQEMLQLIEACRLAHQNVLNIGTACGIRAGFRLLAEAGGRRAHPAIERLVLRCNSCAALAISIVCSVNPFKENKIIYEPYWAPDWEVDCYGPDVAVHLKMAKLAFNSVEDVWRTPDRELFAAVEVRRK